MTRLEAISELASLETKEAFAWTECTALEAAYVDDLLRLEIEMRGIKDAYDDSARDTRNRWLPLHKRKQQLKAFLELFTDFGTTQIDRNKEQKDK